MQMSKIVLSFPLSYTWPCLFSVFIRYQVITCGTIMFFILKAGASKESEKPSLVLNPNLFLSFSFLPA